MLSPIARRIALLGLLASASLPASSVAATTGGVPIGGEPPAPATSAPETAPAPPATAVSEVEPVPLTRSQTKSVQRRVHVRADGTLGARTRSGLRRYQSQRKLTRTGRPNLQTLRAMKLGFATLVQRRMVERAAPATKATSDGFLFPLQGTWSYGDAGTAFGERSGRHQGVDLLAACGTPLVAASAGRVKVRKFQAAAGNYVVVTDTPDGKDQVYMHLQAASPLRVGQKVRAGTPLGTTGETGNAQGCHLHFEQWGSPGWYDGGEPQDPRPSLDVWAAAARG